MSENYLFFHMQHNQELNSNLHEDLDNPADIEISKPSKSRFLFLLFFFSIFVFAWAGCFNQFEHRFKKNTDVATPENTLYDPKYK